MIEAPLSRSAWCFTRYGEGVSFAKVWRGPKIASVRLRRREQEEEAVLLALPFIYFWVQ